MHNKAARLDLLARHAFASQKLLQGIARLWRIANAERLLRCGRKSAIPQIGACLGSNGALQLVFEELRSQLHDIIKRCALRLALFHFRIARRHRNACHIGYTLHCFGETQSFKIGQKLEVITGHAAAETMIATLAIFAVKAWRLLAMERTTGPEITLRRITLLAVERSARSYQRRDRDAVSDLIEKGGRKTHYRFHFQFVRAVRSDSGGVFLRVYRRARSDSPSCRHVPPR